MRRLFKDGLLIPDQNQPWLDLADTDTLFSNYLGAAMGVVLL